jgi:hypothetical protein
MKLERNAVGEPQTEAVATAMGRTNVARDERAVCAAERTWSRGGRDRPAGRGAEQTGRWSGRVLANRSCGDDLTAIRSMR